MGDNINPDHYRKGSLECIEAIEGLGLGDDFCAGNVIKYVVRHKHKNGVEDLKKAKWYLERLIRNQLLDE